MANKRGLIISFIFLALFVTPLFSAEIIINQQPKPVYNLGDVITISTTIKTSAAVTGTFQMDLICGGNETTNFYKNGVSIAGGETRNIESSLILSRTIIGNLEGSCRVKAYLGSDEKFTNDFEISDSIDIQSNLSKSEYNPEETVSISGKAIKENGNNSNGYVLVTILDGNSTALTKETTVNNGIFSTTLVLPKGMRSGNYVLRIKAYEKDLSGSETSVGIFDMNLYVKQVPTNLEIVYETSEVEPGTKVKTKAVLRDQAGFNIDSTAFLTIKNSKGKVLHQVEIDTDDYLEFAIPYNEPPSSWKVVAVSHKLTSESSFNIVENENASIEIVNKTVLITNRGNVPYNRTVLVKIGEQPFNLDVYLKVDQSQRWTLSAPDGEYPVEVIADGKTTGASIALTGNAINVKKASATVSSIVSPVVWIFILAILGFVTFMFFKRGYQRSFIGYISSKVGKSKGDYKTLDSMNMTVTSPKSNKAELILSIKGDKQEVSMIAVKVNNMLAMKHSKEGSSGADTLRKITDLAESHRAATYEAQDYLFYIFAPSRTKTFRNEEHALRTAQRIKEILDSHNKTFKQKIDYGISLSYGEIIAKQEATAFKFMGVGNVMIQAKKIASAADNDILMGEKITDKLRHMVKTEKHKHDGIDTYMVKSVKDPEKHQKFLDGFMKRQGKD